MKLLTILLIVGFIIVAETSGVCIIAINLTTGKCCGSGCSKDTQKEYIGKIKEIEKTFETTKGKTFGKIDATVKVKLEETIKQINELTKDALAKGIKGPVITLVTDNFLTPLTAIMSNTKPITYFSIKLIVKASVIVADKLLTLFDTLKDTEPRDILLHYTEIVSNMILNIKNLIFRQ